MANISRVSSQVASFDRLHLAFHVKLSELLPRAPLLAQNAQIRQLEMATGELVLAVNAWLIDGHKSDVRLEYKTIEFPSSPWQFWKQRNAPQWFLERYPVKTTETTVVCAEHHHFVCPHVEVPDDRQIHFKWMAEMSGQYMGSESN